MDHSGARPPFEWDDDAPLQVTAAPASTSLSGLPSPRAAEPDEDHDDDGPDDQPEAAPTAEESSRADTLRRALTDDPFTEALSERQLLRPAIADLTAALPCAEQLAGLNALLLVTAPQTGSEPGPGDGLGLSEREWVEVTCALDRLSSHLDALKLTVITALDHRVLTTRPAGRLRRDSRRPTADTLAPAPALKIAPGSASALVGLARRATDMPLAADALGDGAMTCAQFRVLDTVLRRIPDPAARAQVEAIAVRKAATTVRAQLAAVLEEAAVQADPAYVARATALGVQDRDVRLVRSPVPGCQRVLVDLERSDAAMFWQVLNQAATRAKNTPVLDEVTGTLTEEERTLPQLRADFLISLVIGMFSPAAVQAAAEQDASDEDPAAGVNDEDDVGEGSDPDLPADTRALVRIPTPTDRAELAELHVVVLADDLDDGDFDGDCDDRPDDDGPDDGEGPGSDDGPGGQGPSNQGPSNQGPSNQGPGNQGPGDPAPAPTGPRPPRPLRPPRPRRALAGCRPMGWLPGYGRLDPDTTAAIIDRAPWRRMVADPTTGVLLQRSSWVINPTDPADPASDTADVLTRRRRLRLLRDLPAQPPPRPEVSYRPSSGLAAFIRARDATCIGPACHHAARSGGMQLDHTVAWGPDTPTRLRGGVTAHGNLGCLCQRTHNSKTHGEWLLTQSTPGAFTWTSPAGLVHQRRASPLLPDLLGDLAA